MCKRILGVAFVFLFLAVGQLQAAITAVSLGTGAPPSTLGGSPMTAFPVDSQASPDGTYVNSVASPLGGDVGFSTQLVEFPPVPNGWLTWSNGYSGNIYAQQTLDPTSSYYVDVTLTLPAGTTAFYLYAEPQLWDFYTITATANDGTILSQSPNGDAGAEGYGFYGSDLATITIDADPNAWGYAVGEFGISNSAPSAIPEPGTLIVWSLLGGFAIAAGWRRRKRAA
jgi:hypothetical protein